MSNDSITPWCPGVPVHVRTLYERVIGLRAPGVSGEIEGGTVSWKAIEQRALAFWAPLMDRLEARTERKIRNRREFCRYIHFIAWVYRFEKRCDDEDPTPKRLRINYGRMTQQFDAFRVEFECLLNYVRVDLGTGLLFVAEPRAAVPLLLALHNAVPNPIKRDRRILESLDLIEQVLHDALDRAQKRADLHRHGGNRPRSAMKNTIPRLGRLYKREIGLDPGVSGEVEDGGPFVAFVRYFLEITDPDEANRAALAHTVYNSLKRDRTIRESLRRERARRG